jgi:hypothetical protein
MKLSLEAAAAAVAVWTLKGQIDRQTDTDIGMVVDESYHSHSDQNYHYHHITT